MTIINEITGATSNVTVGTAPKGLAINEATGTIVVANQGSNDVTVISGPNNETQTVAVGNLTLSLWE